jgi:hypothetical protein
VTEGPPRDLDWPTRRWLLWGAIALAALAALILIIVWLGGRTSSPTSDGPPAEQISWSIALSDMAGQLVELKADLPLATPTETWIDGALLERGLNSRWQWDVDASAPQPVVDIDDAGGCDALTTHLDEWISGIQTARGEIFNWHSRAFTQHAVNKMRSEGCEFDESAVIGL